MPANYEADVICCFIISLEIQIKIFQVRWHAK